MALALVVALVLIWPYENPVNSSAVGWSRWQGVVFMALWFAAAERWVITLFVRETGIQANLAEIPTALGLVLLSPASLVLGRVIGTALALGPGATSVNRMKASFNLSMLGLATVLTYSLYDAMLRWLAVSRISVGGAVALFVSIALTHIWTSAMIMLAIRLTSPTARWKDGLRIMGFSAGVTLALGVAAIFLTLPAFNDVNYLWLVAIAHLGLYGLLRVYGSLGDQYERLQKLFDFSRELGSSASVRAGAATTLLHGAALLGTTRGLLFAPWADERHYWSLRDGAIDHLPIESETARAIGDLLPDGTKSAALNAAAADGRVGLQVLREAGLAGVTVGRLEGHSGDGWLVFSTEGATFDDATRRTVLENVASQSASALGRTELVDQLRMENLERQRDALHDRLTTLPNRDYFSQRLEELVERRAPGEEVAVLIIDLDHFKEVNDSLGHHYGDLLLKEVGRRLSQSLRSSEFLARLGGDEFGVLLHNKEASSASAALAQRIAKLLEEPVDIADTTISVSGSIGISFCPRHAEDPATLMRQADIAMYAAKRDDLTFVLYEAQSEKAWLRRLEVLGRLRAADLDDAIQVHYQPQVDLATGEPIAMEALARWRDPDLGPVSPVEFIPVAEQSGLIRPLTMVVLDHSLAAIRRINDLGHDLSVAVNLSGRALLDLEIVSFVADGLTRHRVEPRHLTIEVTESVFVSDSQRLNEVLLAYEDLGVQLSIDDFGTGYSSLSYLRRLPARELKIDRTFVDGMVHDASKLAIVRSTVALAHELGLSAVAEGIEDVPTMALLRRIGCDVGQGYLLGRPMSLDDHIAWLQTPTIPLADELDRVQSLLEAPVFRRPSARRS